MDLNKQTNKQKDLIIGCLQETYLTGKGIPRLRVKGWKMTFQANKIQQQVETISDKADLKPKWSLRINKWNNPSRRYNDCKYISTECWCI
jgi:hypothetical protein